MKDQKRSDERLIRLIAAHGTDRSSPHLEETIREDGPTPSERSERFHLSISDEAPDSASDLPSPKVSDAELKCFVSEELSEERMAELEDLLRCDAELFERYLSFRLEATHSTGPDLPRALETRAFETFVGAHSEARLRSRIRERFLGFLDQIIPSGIRLPAAGAVAAAVALLVIFWPNDRGVEEGAAPLIVADLDLDGGLVTRGAVTGDGHVAGNGTGAIAQLLAAALVAERTVVMSEGLADLLSIRHTRLDAGHQERIAAELNRAVPGVRALASGLDSFNVEINPDSFETIVVSRRLAILLSDPTLFAELFSDPSGLASREVRAVIYDLSPSEISIYDSVQQGILYLDVFE